MMQSRMDFLPEEAHHTVEAVHSTHMHRRHTLIINLVVAHLSRILLMSSLPSGGQSVSMSKQQLPFCA